MCEGAEVVFGAGPRVAPGLEDMVNDVIQGAPWPRSLAVHLAGVHAVDAQRKDAEAQSRHEGWNSAEMECRFEGTVTLKAPEQVQSNKHEGEGSHTDEEQTRGKHKGEEQAGTRACGAKELLVGNRCVCVDNGGGARCEVAG